MILALALGSGAGVDVLVRRPVVLGVILLGIAFYSVGVPCWRVLSRTPVALQIHRDRFVALGLPAESGSEPGCRVEVPFSEIVAVEPSSTRWIGAGRGRARRYTPAKVSFAARAELAPGGTNGPAEVYLSDENEAELSAATAAWKNSTG
jgi:hypothetical protein